MNGIGFFEQVAAIGDDILNSIAGRPTGYEDVGYLYAMAQVYDLLARIHDTVISVTVDVSVASSLGEAQRVMDRIQRMGIKDVLAAEDMCDQLEIVGRRLGRLPADRLGINPADRPAWDELVAQLQQREAETARLYDAHLFDLRQLAWSEADLRQLKAKVAQISTELGLQKARFELLSKRAHAMRAKHTTNP